VKLEAHPLQHLIQNLPFPLVLLSDAAGIGFANDRFSAEFLTGAADCADLEQLAHNPGGGWQAVALRDREGRGVVAWAKAAPIADGVLVLVDQAGGPAWMEEIKRLRGRITVLESLSATDRLTGAWNRVQLERMVDMEISRAKRFGESVTLILLDVDHFKRVNDVHGHLIGDTVLREFVSRIRECMRDVDSLFRWGGDEFVVLAPSVAHHGGAVLAERLRNAIATVPFAHVGLLTASLGVTEHLHGASAESWFQRTDEALYAAKSGGRNRVHVDRKGNSGELANQTGPRVLQLNWQVEFECGEPTIDAEHQELFDLGNAMISAAIEQQSEPSLWRATLDSMLVHLTQHFRNEEDLMGQYGYPRLAEHQRSHAVLMRRAENLQAAVEGGGVTLGHLVNFVVNEVIVMHLLKVDKEFYPWVRSMNGGGADRAGT
jgi:diguanylate cyclase (GGDEF)-like protein/hemerythrin-like metal-binding protein